MYCEIWINIWTFHLHFCSNHRRAKQTELSAAGVLMSLTADWNTAWVNSHASLVPPSSCKWGPAGCPGRSGASTRGRGPAPRTAPSGWCTAGRSRSELSRPRWFLSLGHLRTGSPRWGRLYLLRQRRGQVRSRHSVHYLVHTLQHVSERPFVKEGGGAGLERERLLSSQQPASVLQKWLSGRLNTDHRGAVLYLTPPSEEANVPKQPVCITNSYIF